MNISSTSRQAGACIETVKYPYSKKANFSKCINIARSLVALKLNYGALAFFSILSAFPQSVCLAAWSASHPWFSSMVRPSLHRAIFSSSPTALSFTAFARCCDIVAAVKVLSILTWAFDSFFFSQYVLSPRYVRIVSIIVKVRMRLFLCKLFFVP